MKPTHSTPHFILHRSAKRQDTHSRTSQPVWLLCLLSLLCWVSTSAVAQNNFQVWLKTYNGSGGNNDDTKKVAVDGSGNVYVAGTVYSTISGNTTNDFIVIKYNSAGTQQWTKIYNTGTNYAERLEAMTLDASGNVYLTGQSVYPGSSAAFLTIKYNSAGTQQWAKRFNATDEYSTPNAIAVDASGNVYVAGVLNQNYQTIKYNSAGTQQWAKTYNAGQFSYNSAEALAVDGSGNVYVTGLSSSSAESFYNDYATIKYNSAGTQQWVKRYDGISGDSNDAANSIAVDGSGNVYVTGYSTGSGTAADDYVTIKYNSAGTALWTKRYNAGSYDQATALAIDGSGNVYVTGHSESAGEDDFLTIKYNSAGTTVWTKRYDGASDYAGNDYAQDLKLDGSGNVYVTGYGSNSANDDILTIKYNAAGTLVWNQRYQTGGGNEYGYSLALDASGNVYVAGISNYDNGFYDIITLKYVNPANNHVAMSSLPQTICSGNYYDPGYTLNYQPDFSNPYLLQTFVPATAGAKLKISFSSFNLVNGQDFLTIYDGGTTNTPILGSFTGTSNPGTITATNTGGKLTFQLYRSSASGAPGWVGTFSCVGLAAPTNLTATAASSSRINLTWTDNATTESNYSVERSTASAGPFAVVATLAANTTSYGNTGLAANTKYYYRIRATSGSGNSGYSSVVSATTSAAGLSTVRLNSGGAALSTTMGSFAADAYSTGSNTAGSGGASIANTTDDVLYTTYRRGTVASGSFGYSIPVANGTYTVKLHFAETYFTTTGQRKFNVTAEGAAWLTNYDIIADVGIKAAAVKTKNVTVSDGNLTLNFTSLTNYALVCAIEVLPASSAREEVAESWDTQSSLAAQPNPFNGRTTLTFRVNQTQQVNLEVYDTQGKLAEVLYTGEAKAGKEYAIEWNADAYPTGLYISRLLTQHQLLHQKLVLQK